MCIRLLCSLPTLIVCTIVSQVTLLALLTACSNLFQFIPIYLNLFEFCRDFWVKREYVGILRHIYVSVPSSHISLTYILDKVFIQASSLACEVYIEVSLLCSLPIMVCEIKVYLISVILCYWVCVIVNLLYIYFFTIVYGIVDSIV